MTKTKEELILTLKVLTDQLENTNDKDVSEISINVKGGRIRPLETDYDSSGYKTFHIMPAKSEYIVDIHFKLLD